MTKAMPFLRKYDITFLRPPPFCAGIFLFILLYPNNLVQTSGISGFSRIVTL